MEDMFSWAKKQWGNSDLGDSRRNKRAVSLAIDLLNKPKESLPTQIESWGNLKAAYRLLNREESTHEALQKDHWQNTYESAGLVKDNSVVLFIQDTTSLNYSSHKSTTNLGHIGDHKGGRGIMVHSCLAVEYNQGITKVLGLASQQVWVRKKSSHKNESRSERNRRDKESDVWKKALSNDNNVPNYNWVSVGDRANDIYGFLSFCKTNNWSYLIRLNQNRVIYDKNEEKTYIKNWIKKKQPMAKKVLILKNKGTRQSNKVLLNVSWGKINIPCPEKKVALENKKEIETWVIRCWEESNEENPLEWMLLTNVPVTNSNSALEKIDWYAARWAIEEYHKCLKTGCGIEKRQLKTVEGLFSMLGFLGIIATKLLELKYLIRNQDDLLAKEIIPSIPLKIISSRFKIPIETMTLRKFWHKVASFGGFIGRKSDGDPGWQTLWKGWLRFLDMLFGAEFVLNEM